MAMQTFAQWGQTAMCGAMDIHGKGNRNSPIAKLSAIIM
jgi:hypothetical protein